jgi:DNA-binding NtrC family response regulator
MIIGPVGGPLAAAAKIAADHGVAARHADSIESAISLLCAAGGADLLIADPAIDIRRLAARLNAAHLQLPVVACGTPSDAATAIAARHAGAREYIPLPADLDVIAAILVAVGDDCDESTRRGSGVPSASFEGLRGRAGRPRPPGAAEPVTQSLVGRTVADVERDLILATLGQCLGNRTHAASILGISIRTLRNKLTGYAAAGISVPPPNHGEIRGAA